MADNATAIDLGKCDFMFSLLDFLNNCYALFNTPIGAKLREDEKNVHALFRQGINLVDSLLTRRPERKADPCWQLGLRDIQLQEVR